MILFLSLFAGFAAQSTAQSNCTEGRALDNSTGVCVDCEAGTFSYAGAFSCDTCPEGTFQPNQGGSACLQCPTGTMSSPNNTQCGGPLCCMDADKNETWGCYACDCSDRANEVQEVTTNYCGPLDYTICSNQTAMDCVANFSQCGGCELTNYSTCIPPGCDPYGHCAEQFCFGNQPTCCQDANATWGCMGCDCTDRVNQEDQNLTVSYCGGGPFVDCSNQTAIACVADFAQCGGCNAMISGNETMVDACVPAGCDFYGQCAAQVCLKPTCCQDQMGPWGCFGGCDCSDRNNQENQNATMMCVQPPMPTCCPDPNGGPDWGCYGCNCQDRANDEDAQATNVCGNPGLACCQDPMGPWGCYGCNCQDRANDEDAQATNTCDNFNPQPTCCVEASGAEWGCNECNCQDRANDEDAQLTNYCNDPCKNGNGPSEAQIAAISKCPGIKAYRDANEFGAEPSALEFQLICFDVNFEQDCQTELEAIEIADCEGGDNKTMLEFLQPMCPVFPWQNVEKSCPIITELWNFTGTILATLTAGDKAGMCDEIEGLGGFWECRQAVNSAQGLGELAQAKIDELIKYCEPPPPPASKTCGNVNVHCDLDFDKKGWNTECTTCATNGNECCMRRAANSKTCESNGDPHVRSFDDTFFDCQEEGWQVLFNRGNLKIETKHERQWTGSPAAMNAEFKISINNAVKVSTSAGKITIGDSAERNFASATSQDLDATSSVEKISGNQLKFKLGGDVTVVVNANDFGVGVPAYDFSVTTANVQGVTGLCASDNACVPLSGTRRKLEELTPNGLLTADEIKAVCLSTGCEPESFLYKGCVADLGQIPSVDIVEDVKEAFVSQKKVVAAMETRAPVCKATEMFSDDGLTCVPKPTSAPNLTTSAALPIASATMAFAGVLTALLA